MTLRPYGQIDMIQLHWESIFLSHQCVTTVFAGWSFRTVWNITYLSKCLFNPLMTSDGYILWIPITVITFLSMAQPMKLGTNSPNLCHQKMHIILFWTWRTYRKLVLYTKVKLISNLFFLNCTYPRNIHIIKCHPNDTLPMSYILYKVQKYLECIFCFVIN